MITIKASRRPDRMATSPHSLVKQTLSRRRVMWQNCDSAYLSIGSNRFAIIIKPSMTLAVVPCRAAA